MEHSRKRISNQDRCVCCGAPLSAEGTQYCFECGLMLFDSKEMRRNNYNKRAANKKKNKRKYCKN